MRSPSLAFIGQQFPGTESARDAFEHMLERVRRWYGLDVFGYVVMPEHIHVLVRERVPHPFALFAKGWDSRRPPLHFGCCALGSNWTYTYDQLNRLLQSTQASPANTYNYSYDRFGNRLAQNSSPQYVYDSTNHISSSGVGYDTLGNMTNDGLGISYSYDAENRMIQSGTTVYGYDAEGRRLHTSGAEYLFDLAGRPLAILSPYPALSPYFAEAYSGGRHLGTYTMGTIYFNHTDWLGTRRAMTGVNGAIAQTATSLPYGDSFTPTPATQLNLMRFTDDLHDNESNLEHAAFRQYSNIQGRFTTPDPFLGSMDITNPQSLNRYSYVMNNPINAIDPTGLLGAEDGCTLLSGTGDEDFACAFIPNIISPGVSGGGGGVSMGLTGPGFGGGFSGIPIPGCLLPGECSITLPNAGLGGLLPQLPSDPCAGEFGCQNSDGGNSFLGTGIGNHGFDPMVIFSRTLNLNLPDKSFYQA